MAADDAGLFAAPTHSVVQVQKDGSGTANSETGTVNRIPRSGGAPAEIATGRRLPRALTADDEAVYWVEGDAVFGAVIKAPKNGSPPMALYCRVGVTAISMDGSYIYVHSLLGNTGTLVSVPK